MIPDYIFLVVGRYIRKVLTLILKRWTNFYGQALLLYTLMWSTRLFICCLVLNAYCLSLYQEFR